MISGGNNFNYFPENQLIAALTELDLRGLLLKKGRGGKRKVRAGRG